ncbi:MAG TPA: DUF3147 family protein [Thermoleophilia bacterium]|nr:DUF3147 family protein [Thermoleophilia bacterium]
MTGLHDSVGASPGKLKNIRAGELAQRFAFGAGVSLVAGIIGVLAGPRAGGLFLAFPAILPAALTIIEKKEGRGQAVQDERGSFFGAVGLVPFAVVCDLAILHLRVAVTVLLALLAWAVSSLACYLAAEALRPFRSRPLAAVAPSSLRPKEAPMSVKTQSWSGSAGGP